jgi:type IV pilus assembly protein PilN
MPRINLIPWREAERKQKRQEFAVGAFAAVLFAGIIAFAVNWQMQSAIDHQAERNQYLKDEIAKLDKQIAEILDLEQQKQRLSARIQVIEQLERSRAEVVHLFDQLVRTLPDGIYLTAVKQTDNKIQVKGVAQSSTRVSNYMRNIDSSEWLSNPSLDILETKGSGDAGSDFTLNAVQKNPQLAAAANDGKQVAAAKSPRGASR